MILTDSQIKEYIESGDLSIIPFEESQIQPATYDMRVGKYGATTSTKKKVDIEEEGYILIQGGDYAVLEILEEIKLGSQFTGRFGLRSKFTRKGLIATVGVQIDPGFEGRLIIGLTNLTPKAISLAYKDDLVSVEYHKLEKPSTKPYTGPYQRRMSIGPEEIESIVESEGMALSEMIQTLQSISHNVAELSLKITSFTTQFTTLKWLIGIVIAVIGMVAAVLAFK